MSTSLADAVHAGGAAAQPQNSSTSAAEWIDEPAALVFGVAVVVVSVRVVVTATLTLLAALVVGIAVPVATVALAAAVALVFAFEVAAAVELVSSHWASHSVAANSSGQSQLERSRTSTS